VEDEVRVTLEIAPGRRLELTSRQTSLPTQRNAKTSLVCVVMFAPPSPMFPESVIYNADWKRSSR
jgi:hypothetical protein